ncbi:MAG: ABC transporter substrate-binding protein [Bacillota bacterium]|nr:MAG: ABC transporter substrate-binding protein [Bacillota bacterium]
MKRKLMAFLGLALAVTLLLPGLTGCKKAAEAPLSVTYVLYADPMVDWDPARSWAAEDVMMQNVYETLVRVGPDGKYIPLLATSWQESEDHLKWTFQLREGVKFHSGKVLTAQMAADSLNRTLEMGKSACYIWDGVEEIKAVGELTLEFVLERPLPLLNVVSAAYAAYIYDPSHTTEWYTAPNADGTGPYKFVSYVRDSEVILQKFPDYWGGWPADKKTFEYAILKVVSEAATRRQLLTNGEVDIVEQVPADDLAALAADPNIKISNEPSYQQLYAFLNTQKPPLNNKYIRQALSYLMPYEDIIRYVMLDTATQARGVVPPTLWGHNPDAFQYTYDEAKAKELLALGGKPNGGFKLLYTYTAGDKNEQRVGELFKDALARVGIELEVRGMTVDSKYNLARDPDPLKRQDITMLYWWPDNYDPQGYYYSQFHSEEEVGFNLGGYSSPTVDALIEEAIDISGTSIEAAIAKYHEAETIIIEDAPAIFIYCENYVRPYRADLMGFVENPVYPNVVFFYDLYKGGD